MKLCKELPGFLLDLFDSNSSSNGVDEVALFKRHGLPIIEILWGGDSRKSEGKKLYTSFRWLVKGAISLTCASTTMEDPGVRLISELYRCNTTRLAAEALVALFLDSDTYLSNDLNTGLLQLLEIARREYGSRANESNTE